MDASNYKRLSCAPVSFPVLIRHHAKKATLTRAEWRVSVRVNAKGSFVCEHCGADSFRKMSGTSKSLNRFCSMACRVGAAAAERAPIYSGIYAGYCIGCDMPFVSRRKKLYCQEGCRPEPTSTMPEVKQCKCCDKEYVPVSTGGRPSVYCSDQCRERGRALSRTIGHRVNRLKYGTTHRKRARQAGVAYEPVNKIKVFDRDGWRCQICGKNTPRLRMGGMTTNAPELDHRIPLSKGGGHLYVNVQCACRKCNNDKGNKTEAGQMPMFEA